MAFHALSAQELRLLSRFVSLAHMPKKVFKYALDKTNSIEIFEHLPGGSFFNDNNAWDILCEHFDARMLDNEYFVKCIGAQKTFESIEDIRKTMRANGINRECGTDKDLDEAQVALLLWASVLPLPVQKNTETDSSDDENHANAADSTFSDAEKTLPPKETSQTNSTESATFEAEETKAVEDEDDIGEAAEQADISNSDSNGDAVEQDSPEAEETEISIDQTNGFEEGSPEGRKLDISKNEMLSEVSEPVIPETETKSVILNPSESNTVDASVAPVEKCMTNSRKEFVDSLEKPKGDEESIVGDFTVPETQDDGCDNEENIVQDDAPSHDSDHEKASGNLAEEFQKWSHVPLPSDITFAIPHEDQPIDNYDSRYYSNDEDSVSVDLPVEINALTQDISHDNTFDDDFGSVLDQGQKPAEGPFANDDYNTMLQNMDTDDLKFSPEGKKDEISNAVHPPYGDNDSNIDARRLWY